MILFALLLALQTPPGRITTLVATPLTDTSVVLTWTEVPSGSSAVNRYLIRYGLPSDTSLAGPNLTTGGCGAPVYGSTAAGGRTRSCVLGSLAPNTAYGFEIIAYTGQLLTTHNFSLSWSNRAETTTMERIGPMLVSRPRMLIDTLSIQAASITDFGETRFPLSGRFPFGDRQAWFYDSLGGIVGRGYLLITKP